MKKIYIVLMLAAVFYAVSCNTQEEYGSLPAGEVMFTAVQADNPKTKTTLQSDGSVFWCAGDSIKLFYGSNGSTKMISNNSEPAQRTTFSGSLGEYSHNGRDYFHAVYPYSANNTFDGEAFTISLPEVQSSVACSFADDLFISLARSRDYTLQFYNLCGGVKFSVAESGIKYVTFSGNNNEPLAGKVNVIFNDDGKPVVQTVVDGKTELRLDAPNGGTFVPGEWYYIVSFPATLTAGYTMTFYKDEKFAERVTDTSISIKRAVWGRLTNADGIHTKPEAVDLGLPSGLKWASFNVGASAPEDFGDYFAWGEIEPYYTDGHSQDISCSNWENNKTGYNWASYKFELGTGWQGPFSKYVTENSDNIGNVDNNTELDPDDDAAAINWGGTWRMPTDTEWTELRTECNWTWTTQNGVNGYLITGTNQNSIFLPAAGNRYDTDLSGAGSYGRYWSSSLNSGSPHGAYGVYFDSGGVGRNYGGRYFGFSVRPVTEEGVRVSVTGVSLNKNSLSLGEGESGSLTATVTPSNATQPTVIWSSSDNTVATVDYTGKVTAVAAGTVTITAKTYDGGFTATCDVTVTVPTSGKINGYDWVDLGLTSGLKWATCNVGATSPEDYGDYFAWGETEPYYTAGHSQDSPCRDWRDNKIEYNWASYKWCNGSSMSFTKYNYSSSYGTVDNKYVLDPEDDAATVNWGGSWRMPTYAEWTELRTECTWTWTTLNGVNGRLGTGPNGNSIFLSAAGYRRSNRLYYTGSFGDYWSSSLSTAYPDSAWFMNITSGNNVYGDYDYRDHGRSVRPVTE